ncbi:hypothetical protein OGAPHI_002783 [Ogataea philodendri]|uniref:Bacterial surface antigen (D15) domain-containing protein n=1 Tax=Ogataea philodendri TaxID=1378263 RepID=A0A9P8P8Z6_9ASCO|nr:uncharacterized protein OGAPHI_002783 [Ogataea philodendri]KAH3667134.1 hypothetical protein OGAPHI_002783 [Ogataea philodendri]
MSSPSEVLLNNATAGVNLKAVSVAGGDQFSDNFFSKLLAPLLNSADLTVNQLTTRCQASLANLALTNCFDTVSVAVVPDPSVPDTPLGLAANFNLVPAKLAHTTLGSVYTPEGNQLMLNYLNHNTFGNAELLNVSSLASLVPDAPLRLLNVLYKAPLVDPSLRLFANGFVSSSNDTKFQSDQQWVSSGTFGMEKIKLLPNLSASASAAVSLVKRTTLRVKDGASDEIKTYAGDHLKESLLLSLAAGNLQFLPSSKNTLPVNGFQWSLKNEVTGLSNTSPEKFVKVESSLQLVRSVLKNNLTLDVSAGLGHIINLSRSKTIHYHDKFYLDVLGHGTLGYPGQQQGRFGGTSYITYKVRLLSRLLFVKPTNPLRLYFDLNGGQVTSDPAQLAQASSLRSGVAIGLLYKVGSAADCNLYYQLPLSSQPNVPGVGFNVALYGDY